MVGNLVGPFITFGPAVVEAALATTGEIAASVFASGSLGRVHCVIHGNCNYKQSGLVLDPVLNPVRTNRG